MPDPAPLTPFTIDGKPITAKPGQTIIQAAMDAGVYIPYLCYYPKMKPYGACRMCLVETEVKIVRKVKVKKGDLEVEEEQVTVQKATVASCTAPVQKDVVVRTNTEPIIDLRKGVLDLLMAEHPHGCLTCHRIELCGPQDICQRHVSVTDRCTICPKNERCELKDTMRSLELDLRTPLNYHRRNLPVHTDDPFYDRDYNLCIVCARCVRVCEEVRFDTALTLTNRSGVSLVGTTHGSSLLESGCEFCGACIDVCPVGALVERDYKWEKAARRVKTVCTNCPVGCQMIAEVNRYDKVIRFVADLQGEANNGQACFKGKFAYAYPNSKKRLKYPYVRENGVLKRVTWEDALRRVADKLKVFAPNQVAVISSPRGTNEDHFAAQQFARTVLKTQNVDSGLNTVPEIFETLRGRLGNAAGTHPAAHLERSKCIMVVSGNPTEEQNVLAVYMKKAARAGADMIVIDPRETELTRYTSTWLRVKPGTETLALWGIARVIVDEALEDKEFTSNRTSGIDGLKRTLLAEFDPAVVASECGIGEDLLRKAARIYAKSAPAGLVFGVGTMPREGRAALTDAVVNLAFLTGNAVKDGGGIFPLYPGANTQGAYDMACTPDPAQRGTGVADLAAAIADSRIRAAIIMADGLNAEAEGLNGLQKELARLDYLVVSAVFDTEITATADVVLPAAPYPEQQGTVTNLERRVQMVRRVALPKNEERTGWETVAALARTMGVTGFGYKTAADVFAEIRRVVPQYAGLSHERLQNGGIQWPCADENSPGTAVLLATTQEGQKWAFVDHAPSLTRTAMADSGYPLTLVTGRVLIQPERDPRVAKRGDMNYIGREEVISIHVRDAAAAGIHDGDMIEVASESGPIVSGRARLDSTLQGIVSVTALFGGVVSAMQDSIQADASPYVPGLPLRRVKLAKIPARANELAGAR